MRFATTLLAALVAVAAFAPSTAALPLPAPHAAATLQSGAPVSLPRLWAHDSPAATLASVHGAAACALGDLDADGKAELLVRTVDAAGHAQLSARTGTDLAATAWNQATSAQAVLRCAADLDADHVGDPVLRLAGKAQATVEQAGSVAGEKVQVVLSTVQGATGKVGLSRITSEAATVAGNAQAGVSAATTAAASLEPAAAGAVALVQTQAQGAIAGLPALPALPPLPIADLSAQVQNTVQVDVMDAAGRVVGQVSLDAPAERVLGLATFATGSLPQVAALTSQASAAASLGSQAVDLALYNADGSLAWTTELAASAGVMHLVPGIGDLNADGVADLVVEATGNVAGTAKAQLSAVSGLDGKVLFATSAATGLLEALPLGQLSTGATAILQVAQTAANGEFTLTALDGAGTVLWTAQAAANSFAGNLALDAHTGDVIGFTDLTGDLVADVAVAVPSASGLAVQVLDGATGKVAWAVDLAGATDVMAIASPMHAAIEAAAQATAAAEGATAAASGAASAAAGAVGSATAQAQAAASGAAAAITGGLGPALATVAGGPSDLVALGGSAVAGASGTTGNAAGGLNVTLVRGIDGAIAWSAHTSLADGVGATVSAAGDIDGDGAMDLLVQTASNAAGSAGASGSAATGAVANAVQVLSARTGATLAGNLSLDGVTAALGFDLVKGPAYSAAGEVAASGDTSASPGAGLLAIVCVLGVALVIRRRN